MESTIGGTRRHLVDVAEGLCAAGEDVHVVAATLRAPEFKTDLARLRELGCETTELDMVRSIQPWRDGLDLARLRSILKRVRPDIVHTHSSKAGVLGRLASLSTGVGARVHTPHTFAFLFGAMFSPLKRLVFHGIEAKLGRRTDRMLAVSESEALTIREAGVVDASRLRVVPNGIDPKPFEAAQALDRSSLGLEAVAPGHLGIVVGLLNEAKGQDLALRALAQPQAAEVHLLFAGHGDWRAELEQLARSLGVRDRAHFLGWRSDVPELLATSDFVLIPSRWEGMPYIALEAMACGKALIGARVDGVRDLVREGETGFLCDVEDAAALAGSLAKLAQMKPDEKLSLGARARELVGAEYSSKRMVQRLMDVYSELA